MMEGSSHKNCRGERDHGQPDRIMAWAASDRHELWRLPSTPQIACGMHDYMSKILFGCFQSSVDSEYHTEFLTAELGHVEKELVIGLERGNQVQPQGIAFIQSERKKVVANGKDHMVGNTVEVEDTVPRASLHAELLRDTSHGMLDGELSKEQNQWCLLPVQCLPSWFFIFRKWLPGFSVVAPEQLVDLPVLSQPKDELKELESDYQYPVSPLTTNGTGGSHDAENQQVEACSESNVERQEGDECRLSNADSKQGGGSGDNNSLLIPIFVRHVSGGLTLRVNLGHSWRHLMDLYAQKTKTKLGCQYFVYGGKKVQPDCTLLFYGVKRNTTVHVCGRLLGGVVTVEEYLINNKEKFLTEVTLSDGRVSLEMTKEGCLFLSTWLKCFTRTFADSKSWDGNFTLKDFKVTRGHVQVIAIARGMLTSNSIQADLVKLIQHIRTIFCKNKPNLISNFPPYLKNLTTFLVSIKSPSLSAEDRLFIETHMCCVESAARGLLLVWLRRKYKSLDSSEQKVWDKAMRGREYLKGYASFHDLSNCAVFQDIIRRAQNIREGYDNSVPSTFRLMRDEFMHGPSQRFDKSTEPWSEKFKNDDGIELMIPAYNEDLIPKILLNCIKSKKVDIKSELLAVQVRCTCTTCHHPAHPGSKVEGESSTAGKGKQAATASPGSSEPASPVQATENPAWSPQQPRRSFLDAAKSASASPTLSRQSSSSSGFSSRSSQDTKGKGKQHKR